MNKLPSGMNSDTVTRFKIEDSRVNLDMVRAGADQVIQRLRSIAASVGPASSASQFYMRMRSKEELSIQKKINTQRRLGYDGIPNPNYSFRNVTDFAGIRLVTLYDHQIGDALRFLVSIISTAQNVEQPIFDKSTAWSLQFKEAYFIPRNFENQKDIYSLNRDVFEELVREEIKGNLNKRTQTEIYKRIFVQERKGSYSSCHILFHAYSYHLRDVVEVPLEFQVRTAAEDIWSEINHKRIYKVDSDYMWTGEYNNAKIEAGIQSDDIKRDLNQLALQVEKIANFSRTAESQLNEVWKTDTGIDTPGREKESQISKSIHKSLIATLFFYVSKNKYSDSVERMGRYLDALSDIFEDKLKVSARISVIREAKGTLDRMCIDISNHKNELINWQDNYDTYDHARVEYNQPHKLETEIEVNSQRELLLELEILRLAIFVALEFPTNVAIENCDNIFGIKIDKRLKLERQKIQLFKELYLRACSFIDNPEMKVRPICMLNFWKYMLSLNLDKNLADRNIRIAFKELSSDNSLPDWSVYRVIVPRALAHEIFLDAKQLLHKFSYDEVIGSTMYGLRNELRSRLTQVLIYSNEAFELSRSIEPKRGDLHLGKSEEDIYLDALLIADTAAYFFGLYNHHIHEGNPAIGRIVGAAAAFLRKSKISHYRKNGINKLSSPDHSPLKLAVEKHFIITENKSISEMLSKSDTKSHISKLIEYICTFTNK